MKAFLISVSACAVIVTAHGVELRGNAVVSVTSDTAVMAKDMAMDEARRQIINDALRQYADVDQLSVVLSNAKSADLMNLIATTSIDGEKTSDTTYSANITMTIDDAAARNWLVVNNVQNWLTDGAGGENSVVVVTMSDGLANWSELNSIARAEKIVLDTKYMMGDSITLELPASSRSKFTAAVREAGWRYSDKDGVLRIWK